MVWGLSSDLTSHRRRPVSCTSSSKPDPNPRSGTGPEPSPGSGTSPDLNPGQCEDGRGAQTRNPQLRRGRVGSNLGSDSPQFRRWVQDSENGKPRVESAGVAQTSGAVDSSIERFRCRRPATATTRSSASRTSLTHAPDAVFHQAGNSYELIKVDPNCENCENASAHVRCAQCQLQFCHECASFIHASRAMQRHQIATIGKLNQEGCFENSGRTRPVLHISGCRYTGGDHMHPEKYARGSFANEW